MDEPPGEPWVPAVVFRMGYVRWIEMLAVSLSKVTTRGVDITWASSDAFMKDITAAAPSAFRKPVPHPNPFEAVFPIIDDGEARVPLDKPGKPGI
jgi:hypothetical protein